MIEMTPPAAKDAAVQLRYFLKDRGFDVPLSTAQEALARTRGAPSFQVLIAAEKQTTPKRAQELVPSGQVPVTFTWVIQLNDEADLNDALIEYGLGSDRMPIEDKIAVVCVEQNRDYDFLRNGHPTVSVCKAQSSFGTDRFLVTVQACVTDAEGLQRYAEYRATRAWGQSDGLLDTPEDCLFEILCGSNSRESPDDLGFEYVGNAKYVTMGNSPA